MIKKIYEDIYMIEVELPNNPLKALNSYVIKDKDRSLVIDTGFNREECSKAFLNGLNKLEINIKDADLYITHLHADHSGLAELFVDAGSNIYISKTDGIILNKLAEGYFEKRLQVLKILYDLEEYNVKLEENPGYKYSIKKAIDFNYMEEGDILKVGKYSLQTILTPGHTPGHMCLYESQHKLFFGGDHILDKITPNIGFWGFKEDMLGLYFKSLDKIYDYDIDYLFTSHRNIVRKHKKRIKELLIHHEERLKEILEILKEGQLTVSQVAKRMDWNIRARGWEDFPSPQKWFASEEAMSHLEHLYNQKKIIKKFKDGKLYYELK